LDGTSSDAFSRARLDIGNNDFFSRWDFFYKRVYSRAG
jgi:hypothetical protein